MTEVIVIDSDSEVDPEVIDLTGEKVIDLTVEVVIRKDGTMVDAEMVSDDED